LAQDIYLAAVSVACWLLMSWLHALIFSSEVLTRESSYCFQRVLAIAILSVCPSVCHTGGSVKNGAS